MARVDRSQLQLDVTVERVDERRYVLALAGEVDMHTAPAFERELLTVIDEGGRELVVDLTEASFIDSTLLAILLRGVGRLNGCAGRLSVVAGNRVTANVFRITGLDRAIAVHPTLEEARRQ